VISLTKSFATYLAPYDVTVNAIAPGATTTDLIRDWSADTRAKVIENIPLRRLAEPDEIAAVALFLASDACCYMTGATVDVNGGRLMD
jgi:NAD(P)-dependent dehydrogenase (short-subunit alcohol dehydrogenase family)